MSAILTKHIGHRCVVLDEQRIRCVDCSHIVLLPPSSPSTSTSRSPIPGKDEPRCEQHPTEHAGHCRSCAADAKANPFTPEPRALAGWAALRSHR